MYIALHQRHWRYIWLVASALKENEKISHRNTRGWIKKWQTYCVYQRFPDEPLALPFVFLLDLFCPPHSCNTSYMPSSMPFCSHRKVASIGNLHGIILFQCWAPSASFFFPLTLFVLQLFSPTSKTLQENGGH